MEAACRLMNGEGLGVAQRCFPALFICQKGRGGNGLSRSGRGPVLRGWEKLLLQGQMLGGALWGPNGVGSREGLRKEPPGWLTLDITVESPLLTTPSTWISMTLPPPPHTPLPPD